MKPLVIIAALWLSAVLLVVSRAVLAQAQGPVVYDDARGTDGSCTAWLSAAMCVQAAGWH